MTYCACKWVKIGCIPVSTVPDELLNKVEAIRIKNEEIHKERDGVLKELHNKFTGRIVLYKEKEYTISGFDKDTYSVLLMRFPWIGTDDQPLEIKIADMNKELIITNDTTETRREKEN